MQTVKADIKDLRTIALATSFDEAIADRKMVAPYIAEIKEATADTFEDKIYERPTATVLEAKDGEMYNTEFPFSAKKAKKFTVNIDKAIVTDETTDQINEWFHDPSIKAAETMGAVKELAKGFDREIVKTAVAEATALTQTAIASEADAKALIDEVNDKLYGFNGVEASDIVIVVEHSARKYFLSMLDARMTNLGDDVLVNGVVDKINGITIIFTRGKDVSQDMTTGEIAEDSNKEFLADGAAIVAAKKPVTVYKKAMVSEETNAPSSANNLVNIQKVVLHIIHFAVKVWPHKKAYLYKTA